MILLTKSLQKRFPDDDRVYYPAPEIVTEIPRSQPITVLSREEAKEKNRKVALVVIISCVCLFILLIPLLANYFLPGDIARMVQLISFVLGIGISYVAAEFGGIKIEIPD